MTNFTTVACEQPPETQADAATLQVSGLTVAEMLELRSALSGHIRKLEDYAQFCADQSLQDALARARSALEKASHS